jgi:hypothetical protein
VAALLRRAGHRHPAEGLGPPPLSADR